jgi:hypothetical protein
MGARKFLIAYNINLDTADVELARSIARKIRFSSGGFPCVKAMGVMLQSRNQAQVTMNLTDFERTPMHRVYDAVEAEAERHGVAIAGSEIVGLVPSRAIAMTAEWYLRIENFRPELILENRLAQTVTRGSLDEFLDAIAAPATTQRGRMAAAAAAAMAAAIGSLAARQSEMDAEGFESDRRFFAAAAQAADRAADWLAVAERAANLRQRLAAMGEAAPQEFAAEIETARALAQAAIDCAAG